MVKHNLSHTMYFVLGILAISVVLKYNLAETVWQKSNKIIAENRQHYTVYLNEDEIKDFIRLWPDFCNVGLSKDLSASSHIEHPEEMLGWKHRLWFVYHRMDAQRFLYVQQRIGYLLQAMEIKRSARALIDQLSAQKNTSDNSAIKEMIEFQKKRYLADGMSDQEKKLMKTYETELRELLKQYPLGN